jgi:G:T-mismatch repair DNA endonuclease (very short patch repair protein)
MTFHLIRADTHRRQFDFFLHESDAIVEIHGDFWHGNPKFWGTAERPLREHQKMKQLDDKAKQTLVESNGLRYFYFWEDEVTRNLDNVIARTREIIK